MSATIWADAIGEVHREAAGVLTVHYVSGEDGPRLLMESMLGDKRATQVMTAVVDCLRAIRTAPRRKPTLCLCCPRAIRDPAGVVFCIAIPDRPDARQGIGTAICSRCATAPDRSERTLAAFRRVWPDAREIQIAAGPERVQ